MNARVQEMIKEALVDRYNDRDEQDVLQSNFIKHVTDEFIDLVHALQQEKESFGDLGINFEEKALYPLDAPSCQKNGYNE